MSLTELVREVASKREQEAKLKAVYDEAYEAWIKERFEEINALEASKVERLNAEEKLRAAVLAAPWEEVKATFGVGIRKKTTIRYDEREAICWAIDHGHPNLLSLNTKEFAQVAEALKLDFVKIEEGKQATIARDLSEVLRDVREAEHGRD